MNAGTNSERTQISGIDSEFLHPRADVLGVSVSAIDLEIAVEMAERWIATGNRGYICLTGVHGVMEAHRDPELRQILNQAMITAPDGMPMSWVGWIQGLKQIDRVFGPDFMAAMCRVSVQRGYRNYLYGGKPGVAELLSAALQERFRGLQIVGTCTPPFGDLDHDHEQEILAHIREAKPHIVWVGLSTPKQERFMARYLGQLEAPLLVGVGAAFDYHAGLIRDCSDWIKRAGLQWLHRLMQDPRRLWRRYLKNNPAFLCHIACQVAGLRQYPAGDAARELDLKPLRELESRNPGI